MQYEMLQRRWYFRGKSGYRPFRVPKTLWRNLCREMQGYFFEIHEVIPLKNRQLEIICNQKIAPDVFCLTLGGIKSEEIHPGQFINIHVPGKSLRRPISVSKIYDDKIDLIYKKTYSTSQDQSPCLLQ